MLSARQIKAEASFGDGTDGARVYICSDSRMQDGTVTSFTQS